MPTYNVNFYVVDPLGVFSQTSGGTATYDGPASADGGAAITDNQTGTDGQFLDDSASEAATADTTIGGTSSTGSEVYADESWTLIDTVTGKEFQLVTIRINEGGNTGWYTLSEIPLVPGRVYETVNFDSTPDASAGEAAFSYADYAVSDGIVEGTGGDDTIDGSYTGDPGNDVVDGNDAPGATPVASEFNWSDYSDEQDLRGGVSQNTGGIQVDVSYSDVQTTEEFSAETSGGGDSIYVASGEPFSSSSAGYLFGSGSSDNSTVTLDFSANSGSGYLDEVENVSFRISDIDGLSNGANDFQDIVTVTAFDADGNPVPVTITPGSGMTVSGYTVTGNLTNTSPNTAQGSALFEIAGPVAQIVVEYDNGGSTQQAVYFSDVHFDSVPIGSNDDTIQAGGGDDVVFAGDGDDSVDGGSGADTLHGGAGADTLDGGTGDDTIHVGDGDSAVGGDGDDTFIIDPAELDGGTLTIVGGEGAEGVGDTLDFNDQLVKGSIVYTNEDDTAGGLSGTATLLDGTVVTFSEIETIICFCDDAMILTPQGLRSIKDIEVGDEVITRDRGPQAVRWVGRREVSGTGALAPVRFVAGSLGNTAPLTVSPQHRMLIEGYRAELLFGEREVLLAAKHLLNDKTVLQIEDGPVTYHHILFDNHEVVQANGIWSESYQPGSYSLPNLDPRAREELFKVFPELRWNPGGFCQAARASVNRREGLLLAS